MPTPNLQQFLSLQVPTSHEATLDAISEGQSKNLAKYRERFTELREKNPQLVPVAVIDVERNPELGTERNPSFGKLRTLRTRSTGLVVLEHGKERRLTLEEKCKCAGLSFCVIKDMSATKAEKALGNTIPPPLAACALFPLLQCWLSYLAQQEGAQGGA